MTAQHPQLISTIVFAERLKCLRLKSSSNKQIASACEWITGELRRRAAAALHDAGLPALALTEIQWDSRR